MEERWGCAGFALADKGPRGTIPALCRPISVTCRSAHSRMPPASERQGRAAITLKSLQRAEGGMIHINAAAMARWADGSSRVRSTNRYATTA